MKRDILDVFIDKFYHKIEVLISRKIEPTIIVHDIKNLDLNVVDALLEKGIKGMILDVDETLRYDGDAISQENINWLVDISSKMNVAVVSNGYDRNVEYILNELCIKYFPLSFKPCSRNIKKALDSMRVNASSTIIVGDRYLDDIYSGSKLGMMTCLVKEKRK